MTEVDHIQKVFFIGIGGIGMSALARYFHEKGRDVSGYDRSPSFLTGQLEKEGMKIVYEEKIIQEAERAELIVYTPAVGKENIFYS